MTMLQIGRCSRIATVAVLAVLAASAGSRHSFDPIVDFRSEMIACLPFTLTMLVGAVKAITAPEPYAHVRPSEHLIRLPEPELGPETICRSIPNPGL
jgi:hypothetical protein